MSDKEVLSVSRKFTFEMAHHLPGHNGLCVNIHGHSYSLMVTLKGEPINQPGDPKDGMLIDFGDLKSIVQKAVLKELDHALVLRDSPESQNVKRSLYTIGVKKIILLQTQPTCENVLLFIKEKLVGTLPKNLVLTHLLLKETANTRAEWWLNQHTNHC